MRDTTASFISIHSLVVSEALLSLTPPHSRRSLPPLHFAPCRTTLVSETEERSERGRDGTSDGSWHPTYLHHSSPFRSSPWGRVTVPSGDEEGEVKEGNHDRTA